MSDVKGSVEITWFQPWPLQKWETVVACPRSYIQHSGQEYQVWGQSDQVFEVLNPSPAIYTLFDFCQIANP